MGLRRGKELGKMFSPLCHGGHLVSIIIIILGDTVTEVKSLQLASQMHRLASQTQPTSASQQELKDEREGDNSNVGKTDSPI